MKRSFGESNDTTYAVTTGIDPLIKAVRDGHVVHKFGHNPAVGTTLAVVSNSAVYRTPQPANATTLRIKAGGNANDTATGSGARAVTIIGLGPTGYQQQETLATNGALASSSTTLTFIRIFRVYVSASGTYATQSTSSHAGPITIENTAGTEDWVIIPAGDFAHGQSQIGVYTVPIDKTAYIHSIQASTAATKVVDLVMFQRENILQTTPPYSAMKLVRELVGIEGDSLSAIPYPLGPFKGGTDVGFMAKVTSGTASVSIDFVICLV